MNNALAFDFKVNKDQHSITALREFAAERPLVWDAYTKSEILDQWWAPKPWRSRTRSMNFSENGRWHYAMIGPEGEEHWALAEYRNIVMHERFTAFDAFTDAEGNINQQMPQSRWEVTFTDKGPVTLVQFQITYNDLVQLEETIKMGFREGLTMAMEGLDELLPRMGKV